MERRVWVEAEFKTAFGAFLEEVGDVMQLYYSNRLGWGVALSRIDQAARELRRRQSEVLAKLAEETEAAHG